MFYYDGYGRPGLHITLHTMVQTKQNRVHCRFKDCHCSLLASLPLLVIFCNKMAVVPESRVLTFSVFKWSSFSSTYLPE